MKPLTELTEPGRIQGLLFDIDDTLTTEGRLTAEAYGALERLKRAGRRSSSNCISARFAGTSENSM